MIETILFISGLLIGYILARMVYKPSSSVSGGTLMLYKGDNDEFMSLYVELEQPPENLYDRHQVTFNVKTMRG